jgi:hypothetical protein
LRGERIGSRVQVRGLSPPTFGVDDLAKKEKVRDLISSKMNMTIMRNSCRGRMLSLDVVFYIHDAKEKSSPKDLDNMLKIFCDVFPDYMDRARQKLGLGLVEHDNDHMIYEIRCSKKLVKDTSEEGFDLDIFQWHSDA